MQTLLIFAVAAFAICAEIMTVDGNNALRAVAESTNGFSNNFLKVVAKGTPGNLITSPLSAQMVLAMAAYGAGGTTATQMRSVLLMPAGDDEFSLSGYKSLIETLTAVKGVELRLANKIYTARQFSTKDAYKKLTAENFFSASQEVDFNNPVAAAETINSWCLEQTNNRIKDVITPDSLTPDTRLVLVNAVYFKGIWARKFNTALTRDRPFHVDARTTKNVPTMFLKDSFRFGNLPQVDARFIELPYTDLEVSMVIILPNQVDGLQRVEDNLHQVNLTESLSRVHPREVDLYLPKFKTESTIDLKGTLEQMGMTTMFQNDADFSGISDMPMKVSKVIQKAFIEVNEEGSEAAAVTGLIIKDRVGYDDDVIKVDRPFLYLIVDRTLESPLFNGQILSPTIV